MKYVRLSLILSIGLFFFASCANNTEGNSSTQNTEDSLSAVDKLEVNSDTLKPESPRNSKEENITNSEKKVFSSPKEESIVEAKDRSKLSGVKLSSWNHTASKKRILQFIEASCNPNSSYFIPEDDRIATLDNDGTIWAEQPTYYQIEYVIYRLKQLEPEHPEWEKNKLIQAALNHDLKKLREKYGIKGLAKLLKITQSGMSTKAFEKNVRNWALNASHPIQKKKYTDLVYKPMQELIRLLKAHRFKVYIVSSGGTDFIRAFSKPLFNIDKEYIIGSYQKLKYVEEEGQISLIKMPEILCVSEDKGKVMNIQQVIGKKPVLAIGNSDRDIPMLKWSQQSEYKNMQIIIHHTDTEREWKYDKGANNGALDAGLQEAKQNHWVVVDIKKDWNRIF